MAQVAKRLSALAGLLCLAAPAWGQVTVTSIQSSLVGANFPNNVQGITSAAQLPGNGFTMYVNGSFPDSTIVVQWFNPVTGVTYSVQPFATGNQLQLFIPENLYLTPVASTQTVQITVTQGMFQATGQFFVNAPLQIVPTLPLATVGVAYNAPIVAGGTPPYTAQVAGTTPPGLNITGNQFLSGTPTAQGLFNFTPRVDDQWVTAQKGLQVQVIAPATISTVVPNSAAAGAGIMQIAVNGTNFVDPQSAAGGSVVRWTFNNVTTNLVTTYVSATQLTAIVPTALMSAPGIASVSVLQPDNTTSAVLPLSLLAPVIGLLSPSTIPAGGPGLTLTVNGANFADRTNAVDALGIKVPQIQFGAALLTAATFVNSTTVTFAIPANLVNTPGPIIVREINPGGAISNALTFTVTSTLAITTASLPAGTSGTPYSARVSASGGSGGYIWFAGALPPGLAMNPQTGDIFGTPLSPGTFPALVRVTDSQGTNVQAAFTITINLPPPTISTPSNLPGGTVGVPYQATIGVGSGGGPFTFAVTSGNLPDGLSLTENGLIYGTPSKTGTFGFTITATDPNGNAPSKSFTIAIAPAALTPPPGGGTTNATSGTAVTIDLTPTGGVPPYRYSVNCTLPPGLTLSNGAISGTPTTPGTYACRVVISDSAGTVVTKDITITVAVAAITFQGSTLPAAQVGVSYSASVLATGGTPPLTYAATGLPGGLSLSASGAISGTPGAEGSSSFSVTATDSTGARATASFTITIAPAKLTVTTGSLPDGVAGASYAASLAASGGVRPYTWTVTGLPGGVTASSAGAISGTPDAVGRFSLTATVKDNAGATAAASFTVTIAAPPLVITTASAASGTVGAAYTASFAATGGVTPLTWSATGLPGGLSMSSAGAISGTPTTPGTSNVSVTVRDSAGAAANKAFTIAIALPAAPPLNFLGITDTSNPLQQPRVNVSLGAAYPVDVVVTLTLTFAPDAGADDPTIVFSSGGRTARITVPAGSLTGSSDAGVQTGTVAGLITIVAQLQATGVDVTPSPAPRRTIRISPAAPVMTTVAAARTSTGFTVTINGYVTGREVAQALFTFNPAAGSTLQTTSLTVAVDALFSGYFGGSAAAPFGSQFTFTQPFTVNGNLQAVTSVTVTLVNRVGNSTAATVNLN